MVLEVVIVIFLVLLNGFFVAAEFAIVKVRASQLEVKTAANKRLASTTKHIMDNLDGYLAATQLGITIASLGLGWLGEDVFSKIMENVFHSMGIVLSPAVLHTIAGSIAFVFVTFMHVVFGELMPKSIAIRYALPTSITLAYPLQFCYFIFRPFIYLFNGFANFMLTLMGVGATGHGHGEAHSEEELRFILQESKQHQEDLSDKKKYELIDKVFDFDDKPVSEIMTSRGEIISININDDPEDILDTVLNNKFSRYPVHQGDLDHLVGILHVQSLLENLRGNKGINLREKGVLTPPIYVPTSMRVGDLLLDLQKNKKHLAIVVDEHGGMQGLTTLEDIIEELLGEIYDEYDDTDIVHSIGDNCFLVNATAKIIEVNQYLPIPLPVPEGMRFGTVAGLVRQKMTTLITIGATTNIDGYEVKITNRSKKNKIKVVELCMKLPEIVE